MPHTRELLPDDFCGSFLFPPCRRFLFTFMHAIALAFEDGSIGMMRKTIEQSGDASSIGKDLVPFFKGSIGSDNHRAALVAAIDDLVEKICGVIVV